jgi:acetyl-CoA carboxylase biotin carboxyl carrier protein
LDFADIERILELVRLHDLGEFELEVDGLKVRVRKASAGYPPLSAPVQLTTSLPSVPVPLAAAGPPTAIAASPASEAAGEIDAPPVELAVVKSPIVGTFYRSPEPGAASFVEVGERVRKDQVLCIIEAMKLMNEITSEYEGEIARVYVENGKPVQYGERLFAIKTD